MVMTRSFLQARRSLPWMDTICEHLDDGREVAYTGPGRERIVASSEPRAAQ
jgi:hypothetical protein